MGFSIKKGDNMAENLVMKSIWDLHNYSFQIPYQQRGYKWTSDNIIKLLEDLMVFLESEDNMYCLQPIAVVPEGKDKCYSLIDGQQRLTTLYLLYKYLISDGVDLTEETELFHYKYARDDQNERKHFLQKRIVEEDQSTIDYYFISHAYNEIRVWFNNKSDDVKKDFIELLKNAINKKSIQVIWYIVDKKKEHETFRNINSGKIQLCNSDLIKALFLNRKNGIEKKEQIAAQFELMERQFAEDRFWYMLSREDVEIQKGQSRMDFIFNLVADINDEAYQIEPRKAFYKLSSYNGEDLVVIWKSAREKFQRIKDIYENPYTFHYVGFLVYCGANIREILRVNEKLEKQKFIEHLKKEIKSKLSHNTLDEYSYADTKEALRRVFVLHNIETILQRYAELKQNNGLKFSFEYFPFELLSTQVWHIEHIASRTDNDLKSISDRKDWLESIKTDYSEIFDNEILKLQESVGDFSDEKKFKQLYNKIMETEKIKEIEEESIKDEELKNGIGNLVLLDAHTNTSFHNSLFPRKRMIVIIASGLRHKNKNDDEIKEVRSVYVPICTQQVYTKAYNKGVTVKLNSWTKDDYYFYFNDMKEKLSYYFGE